MYYFEVDGKGYDIKLELKNGKMIASYLEKDNNWYQLSAKLSEGFNEYYRSLFALKGENKELFNDLVKEFRFERFLNRHSNIGGKTNGI